MDGSSLGRAMRFGIIMVAVIALLIGMAIGAFLVGLAWVVF